MASDQRFAGLASGEAVCERAILRLVPSIRWDADKVGVIHVTPFDYKSRHQDVIEEDPDRHSHPEPKPEYDAIEISKKVKILDSDLKHVGYTENRCATWPTIESKRNSTQRGMSISTL